MKRHLFLMLTAVASMATVSCDNEDLLGVENHNAYVTNFERMFGAPLSEAERARLDAIEDLAPGDFRTVRQSLHYLGASVDNAMRLGELEKESAVKRAGCRRVVMGF